jgi:dTDP-4-amino-4,6-dideoxygalactose transaminase
MAEIPLVDLKREYQEVGLACLDAARKVAEQGAFILGPELERFERAFAEYCGAQQCIGVGNGGDALYLALRALGIGPGDEVVTPVWTFIATLDGISRVGAKPVLLDNAPGQFLPGTEQYRAAITTHTKALLPVHLYGQPVDLAPLRELCDAKGLALIEDAAQAHGAHYRGGRVGSVGDAACFSFYPAKNLGAWGDGGAVVTSRPEVAERIRVTRNYGSPRKYQHEEVGLNSRLDPLHAAVLNVKLGHLDRWNQLRRAHAARYRELLADVPGLALPREQPWGGHVYHVFVTRHPRRDALMEHLRKHGVGTVIHYPVPNHLAPAYQHLGKGPGSFPEAERCAKEVLSLPMFPQLTDDDLQHVAKAVRGFA